MIEYILTLLLLKALEERGGVSRGTDDLDRCLDIGAGLDFEPPVRKRPDLKVVKCQP